MNPSQEIITHFLCDTCKHWWSISVPTRWLGRTIWWCPWCGDEQKIEDEDSVNET